MGVRTYRMRSAWRHGIVLGLMCAALSRAATVELRYDDDRAARNIGATVASGFVYASVTDLCRGLDLKTKWSSQKQQLIVSAGRVTASFTAWNPIVIVDDVPYNLPAQPILMGGKLLVPAGYAARLLDPISPGRLEWRTRGRRFELSVAQINVRPGAIEQRENGTFMSVVVPADLPIEEATGEPNWLHLTILRGQIDTRAFRQLPLGDTAVLQVLAYQHQNSATLSIRLKRGYSYDLRRAQESDRIMLLFRQIEPLPSPLSYLREVVEIDRDQWSIGTIVIDPGHGGRDPGCVGEGGIYEKDVVLAIASRLADRLKSELGVEVVMTRTDDRLVRLGKRGRIATGAHGKLFVSIHCNANEDSRVSGAETYFLSDAETDAARAVAQLENSALRFEDTTSVSNDGTFEWQAVGDILVGMTSDHFLRESQELAIMVQNELVRSLAARDLGVHQAEFYVMKGTLGSMPSILVEVGFLSNAAEARKLRRTSYQRRAADALFRAIREFKSKYESEL